MKILFSYMILDIKLEWCFFYTICFITTVTLATIYKWTKWNRFSSKKYNKLKLTNLENRKSYAASAEIIIKND